MRSIGETKDDRHNYCVVMRASARLVIDQGNAIVFNASSDFGPIRLRIFTNHVDEGHDVAVPRELIIQANGPAPSLRQAVSEFHRIARPFPDLLAFCANAHVALLEPHLAWDDTDGEPERDFMEVYLRDERGLPLTGRRLKLPATRAVLTLTSQLNDAEASAFIGVLSRYGVALSHWHLGGETAAFTYLWFSVEALAKLIVSRELNAGRTPEQVADEHGMPRKGGVRVRNLEAYIRREVIFEGNLDTYQDAYDASNDLEHASAPLREIHDRTSAVAPKVFSILRGAILRFLDPDLAETRGLLEGLTALPLDIIQRRIVHGEFINVEGELAHPDKLYPVLEWRPRVSSLTRNSDGDYNATFADKWTVRCAPGVEFRLKAYEVVGRDDGSSGLPPTPGEVTINANEPAREKRNRMLGFLDQVDKAIRSLGPGETGAEYSQPDAHLLEIFNMMKGAYRGCVLIATRGLPDEALILGRSVFRDAMRLHEAASIGTTDRAALAFGWRSDSLNALEQLLTEDGTDTQHEVSLKKRRSAISQVIEKFEVEEVRSFASPRDVAARLTDDDYYKLDRMTQALSEGWDLVTMSKRQQENEQLVGLHDVAVNDWAYPLVAKYVGGGCLLGAQAALSIFEWPDPDSLVTGAFEELDILESQLEEESDTE